MAKVVFRILDDISPSDAKLRNIPRPPDGLHNMFINEKGQVEKRKGYRKYSSVSDDSPIIGIHRFYNEKDNSKELIVACRDRLYKIADEYPHNISELSGVKEG